MDSRGPLIWKHNKRARVDRVRRARPQPAATTLPKCEPIDSSSSRRSGRSPGKGGGSGASASVGRPRTLRLFRELCVERRAWLTDEQFERALALLVLRRAVVRTLLAAGLAGVIAALLGAAIPH